MDNGFDKSKHLCSEKDVALLYERGKKVTCFPFRAVYRLREEGYGVKVMFVVRKKDFHHAVDRNRWKRMMREAYRTKQGLLEGLNLDIAVLVIVSKMMDSGRVAEKMEELLRTISNRTCLC